MDRTQRDFQPSYGQHSLATPLNLSQTLGEYTLTLKRAYADGHGIEVVAFYSADPENELTGYSAQLNDDVGSEYAYRGHSIGGGEVSLSFKMPEVSPLPAVLNMHLEVGVFAGNRFDHNDNVSPPPQHPSGRFKFDFSLPYYPARSIEVNQTVVSDANSMTLERVSLAPSSAISYLRVPPVDVQPAQMMGTVTLAIAGHENPGDKHGMLMTTPYTTNVTFHFSDLSFDDDPLYKQDGIWAVTVSGLQYRDFKDISRSRGVNGRREAVGVWVPAGQPMPTLPGFTAIPGEWVFNFTVQPPPQK